MAQTRTYTASVVTAVAGVNATTLRAWRNRGILELETPAQDPDDGEERGWTRYTLRDLLRVAALKELTRYALEPASTKSFANAVADAAMKLLPIRGLPPKEPNYFIAAAFQQGTADVRGSGVVPELIRGGTVIMETGATKQRLRYFFDVNLADDLMGYGASAFVIDAAKLLRRVLANLDAAERKP